ncbi:unnamed protein product, partial [Rotaria sp. Silwood1]
EATSLHKALLPSKEFQQQVYLKVARGLYSVSIIEFLRSGRHEQDPQKNMAWVRCRGSSVLNFDCFSIWQMMLTQHPKVNKSTEAIASLKIQHFPVMNSSRFALQLSTWYSCDDKTSSLLDNAMNYRRKIISINIPYVGDDLVLNLHTFEFSNNGNTIVGYIRWIPKLISNTGNIEQKIVFVDNYQSTVNIQPIPLTTKRWKLFQEKYTDEKQANNLASQEDNDDDDSGLHMATRFVTGNDDEAYDADDDIGDLTNKRKAANYNNDTWSITDLNDENPNIKRRADTDSSAGDNKISGKPIGPFPHEKVGKDIPAAVIERPNPTLQAGTIDALNSKLEGDLKQQLVNKQTQEQKLKDLIKQIKAFDYDHIESFIAQNYLFSKTEHIINHLKTKHPIDDLLPGILTIRITEKNNVYCVSVTGLQVHHDEFKLVLKQLQILSNAIQSAETSYKSQLNGIMQPIIEKMTKQIHSSQDWQSYTKYFQQLIQNKIQECVKLFDEYITHESQIIAEQCIRDVRFGSLVQLEKQIDRYMQKKSFISEIEVLKHEAFEEFIKQHVLSQQLKFERKPSIKSVETVNEFIDKVRKEFRTNKIYVGCDVEQLKLIPKLLQRVMLYYRCFTLQLPLYESSKEFLDKFENSNVITVTTSTGSGKSSLLPALLIAEGYEKVIVTQPRRLTCEALCDYVNKTMTTNKDGFDIAGWAVTSAHCNANAQILYLTDALLKERLLYDENLIRKQTNNNNKPIVFFIDEIHERSVNIDLCLALFARLLTEKPNLKSKVKIIISSATLDPSITTVFRQIPQLKFNEFYIPNLGKVYHVAKFARSNQNILDLIQEICKTKQRYDQILCFVSSVAEVNQCCHLIQEISHGTITAFPLIQSQSAADQQKNIEQGSIFFSTTVAETSLTFPSLRYVIDTGMINIPVYDCKKKQTIATEIRAAESTIKQRLGRLGRTKPGEYYSLYNFKVEDKKYPTPQICQSELVNIEFSLRKSLIKNGLHYMKKFLPNAPSEEAIAAAVEYLRILNILDSQDKFTSVGVGISELPDLGSLAMSKSVLSALNQHNCGRDLIVLSAILGVLNTSSVLKAIPDSMKRSEGDFMSLLNVMNEILLVKKSVSAQQFRLSKVCQAKKLTAISHVLKQALRRYVSLEKSFNLSSEYREKAQVSSDDWESIAKSLLNGYGENVFVSMKELQGKTHLFTRYSPPKEDVAVLDLQSTLIRAITSSPVSLVIARDIRFSSSIRATAVLSFVGEIKSQWIAYSFKRQIKLNAAEEAKLNSDNILTNAKKAYLNVQIQLNNHILSLEGSAGSVLDAELDILQQLVVEMKFNLSNEYAPTVKTDYERMQRNLEGVSKMPSIFNPMKWRWEAQHQVKITVNNNNITNNECEITIEGRDSQNQFAYNEFRSFLGWLRNCAVIRHPNA